VWGSTGESFTKARVFAGCKGKKVIKLGIKSQRKKKGCVGNKSCQLIKAVYRAPQLELWSTKRESLPTKGGGKTKKGGGGKPSS